MISRRVFLADLGKGVAAAVVLASCSGSTEGTTRTTAGPAPGPVSTIGTTTTAATPTTVAGSQPLAWERVDLGFVSAYLLHRAGEAAVVDTGVAGSEDDIATGLAALDLSWDSVGHVILTHKHPDHAGSIEAVLDLATGATGYAGADDIPSITSPRELVAVGDGDSVFGLEIIATPGHTPGHVSVLDPGRLLVAGDALNGSGGGVIGPNPDFSDDMTVANASVVKLADFRFEAVVFGHGEPVLSGADRAVAALAASL